jgi:ligand-binding SRPBCC domain-containing protein
MAKIYSIKRTQKIPINLNTAWNFFCKPGNLKQMTPDNIDFNIVSPVESPVIYVGQVLKYKMTSMIGLSIQWVTEITEVEEKKYFIDEQRSGPFKLWRHYHYFVEIPGGIEMTDIVHYKFRFGIFGDIVQVLFLKRRLNKIFNYRFNKLVTLLGEYE